jgi:hypothetical protein
LKRRVITVFGSARTPPDSDEFQEAFETGRAIASHGFDLCNGGYGGAMEASARGAHEAGGHTIGIVADIFPGRVPNAWMREIILEHSLIDRMLGLISRGDAYLVLKGGTGTLLELAAVWEFVNKGLSPPKPILTVGSFWDPVVQTLAGELAWEGQGQCTTHVRMAASGPEAVRIIHQHFQHPG